MEVQEPAGIVPMAAVVPRKLPVSWGTSANAVWASCYTPDLGHTSSTTRLCDGGASHQLAKDEVHFTCTEMLSKFCKARLLDGPSLAYCLDLTLRNL